MKFKTTITSGSHTHISEASCDDASFERNPGFWRAELASCMEAAWVVPSGGEEPDAPEAPLVTLYQLSGPAEDEAIVDHHSSSFFSVYKRDDGVVAIRSAGIHANAKYFEVCEGDLYRFDTGEERDRRGLE